MDPSDPSPTTQADRAEAARPRFWGPASWWRLGLVALLLVIVVLWLAQ